MSEITEEDLTFGEGRILLEEAFDPEERERLSKEYLKYENETKGRFVCFVNTATEFIKQYSKYKPYLVSESITKKEKDALLKFLFTWINDFHPMYRLRDSLMALYAFLQKEERQDDKELEKELKKSILNSIVADIVYVQNNCLSFYFSQRYSPISVLVEPMGTVKFYYISYLQILSLPTLQKNGIPVITTKNIARKDLVLKSNKYRGINSQQGGEVGIYYETLRNSTLPVSIPALGGVETTKTDYEPTLLCGIGNRSQMENMFDVSSMENQSIYQDLQTHFVALSKEKAFGMIGAAKVLEVSPLVDPYIKMNILSYLKPSGVCLRCKKPILNN